MISRCSLSDQPSAMLKCQIVEEFGERRSSEGRNARVRTMPAPEMIQPNLIHDDAGVQLFVAIEIA
jgi:hypothetical protein